MNSNDNELLVGRDDISAALIAVDEGQLFDNIYRLCLKADPAVAARGRIPGRCRA